MMKQESKLFEQIAIKIRNDIKEGKFKVGEKIPSEPALMELYQVGRSTIREAIKSLTLSGILTVQQGFGTKVNAAPAEPIEQRLRSSDFEEINQVRALLEQEIVRLATQNRNDSDLKAIGEALEKRKLAIENDSRAACANADIEFHLAIARASGNRVLSDLYESFTVIIRDFFAKRSPSGIAHFAMSHYLHQALFDAITNRNADTAREIITTILNNNH
ncbi:FadR/GntR family transcriptional regulator [Pedobacter jeongneungensis]|uniref:FadR/GntR family transcriptional regulator n=1 Tax=Pedobacter jeongneungensis TaxID=947309 RepID=UPI0004A7E8A5|nr:FadR/GntR family transcriptional regulator [Pedobacter jeongneungensis]